MASIGLPGLNGFVGEVLSLAGMFRRQPVYAVLGATGVVLGAWYLLSMIQHAFFGPLREPKHSDVPIEDMNRREMFAIAPICALCLLIGLMPQLLLNLIQPDVDAIVALYEPTGRQVAAAPAIAPGRIAKVTPPTIPQPPAPSP
jgi:NADH-quinone oxidoreductase subunit M